MTGKLGMMRNRFSGLTESSGKMTTRDRRVFYTRRDPSAMCDRYNTLVARAVVLDRRRGVKSHRTAGNHPYKERGRVLHDGGDAPSD